MSWKISCMNPTRKYRHIKQDTESSAAEKHFSRFLQMIKIELKWQCVNNQIQNMRCWMIKLIAVVKINNASETQCTHSQTHTQTHVLGLAVGHLGWGQQWCHLWLHAASCIHNRLLARVMSQLLSCCAQPSVNINITNSELSIKMQSSLNGSLLCLL